jgi:CO dehydrogenase/acetyl-CoA synthase beta subunit
MTSPETAEPDMQALVTRARKLLAEARCGTESAGDPLRLLEYRRSFDAGSEPANKILLAADTAVELGPPARASAHAVIWTAEPEMIRDGRVSLLGPDLAACLGAERDYAQIILLGIVRAPGLDLFRLEAIQFLTRRLPGVMARVVPGRLWLRVSHQAIAAGLDFALLGTALAEAFRREVRGILAVESVFITSDRAEVEKFSALAAEARIYSGRHRKISLGGAGDYECEELNCESCEEKPVCDQIREVTAIRRRTRSGRGDPLGKVR